MNANAIDSIVTVCARVFSRMNAFRRGRRLCAYESVRTALGAVRGFVVRRTHIHGQHTLAEVSEYTTFFATIDYPPHMRSDDGLSISPVLLPVGGRLAHSKFG